MSNGLLRMWGCMVIVSGLLCCGAELFAAPSKATIQNSDLIEFRIYIDASKYMDDGNHMSKKNSMRKYDLSHWALQYVDGFLRTHCVGIPEKLPADIRIRRLIFNGDTEPPMEYYSSSRTPLKSFNSEVSSFEETKLTAGEIFRRDVMNNNLKNMVMYFVTKRSGDIFQDADVKKYCQDHHITLIVQECVGLKCGVPGDFASLKELINADLRNIFNELKQNGVFSTAMLPTDFESSCRFTHPDKLEFSGLSLPEKSPESFRCGTRMWTPSITGVFLVGDRAVVPNQGKATVEIASPVNETATWTVTNPYGRSYEIRHQITVPETGTDSLDIVLAGAGNERELQTRIQPGKIPYYSEWTVNGKPWRDARFRFEPGKKYELAVTAKNAEYGVKIQRHLTVDIPVLTLKHEINGLKLTVNSHPTFARYCWQINDETPVESDSGMRSITLPGDGKYRIAVTGITANNFKSEAILEVVVEAKKEFPTAKSTDVAGGRIQLSAPEPPTPLAEKLEMRHDIDFKSRKIALSVDAPAYKSFRWKINHIHQSETSNKFLFLPEKDGTYVLSVAGERDGRTGLETARTFKIEGSTIEVVPSGSKAVPSGNDAPEPFNWVGILIGLVMLGGGFLLLYKFRTRPVADLSFLAKGADESQSGGLSYGREVSLTEFDSPTDIRVLYVSGKNDATGLDGFKVRTSVTDTWIGVGDKRELIGADDWTSCIKYMDGEYPFFDSRHAIVPVGTLKIYRK